MRFVMRGIRKTIPFVPLAAALFCWWSSYDYMVNLEVHNGGPRYGYLSSWLGRLEISQGDEGEAPCKGVRKEIRKFQPEELSSLTSLPATFDAVFLGSSEVEVVGVSFPYWFLCALMSIWPAACVRKWMSSRRERANPAPEPWRPAVPARTLQRLPWPPPAVLPRVLLAGRARRCAPRML